MRTMAIEKTRQEREAEQVTAAILEALEAPTATEREVDTLIEALEEAELLRRLAASAAWRA